MPLPTLVDLAAERIWILPQAAIAKMVESLPVHLCEKDAINQMDRPFYRRITIKDIAMLVHAHYPGQHSQALDSIWARKGEDATVEDLRSFWKAERNRENNVPTSFNKTKKAWRDWKKGAQKEEVPPVVLEPQLPPTKVSNYVPNGAELYGYELWCEKDALPFSKLGGGWPLSASQTLTAERTDWTRASFPMIMAMIKTQFPVQPTPSLDHLWRSDKHTWPTSGKDLLEFWHRLAAGTESILVYPDPVASTAWTANNSKIKDAAQEVQNPTGVAQDQAHLSTEGILPTLLELKQELATLSDSLLTKPSEASVSDWSDLASHICLDVADRA